MIVALPVIAGHTSEALVRDDAYEWMVRTRFGGRATATRIGRGVLPAGADGRLRSSVLAGAPLDETLPWELRRILEGHRVRASLPVEWPLPTVLAAGLAAHGHPYVTRAWIDGLPLARAWPACTPADRDEIFEQILALLAQLHASGVVIQDLKPDNIVRDGSGRVWLVDLESLRRAPNGAVPCTHYTPRYAAPEQLVGRSSAPASDLFAFGRMVTELAAGAPGPRWATLAAACQVLDPRLRPTATDALRWAWGEAPASAEATIRVDEPVSTLAPLPVRPAPELPDEVPRRRRWPAILGVLALLGSGLGSAIGTPAPGPDVRPQQSAALVAQVRDGLRAHKVVAAKNTEPELLRWLVVARQAAVLDPSPEALAEVALATVWSQRWHWKGARWNAAAFAEADRSTRAALAAGPSPEALLARGLAAAAACRHGPASLPRRDAWCEEALSRLDQAAATGEDWLVVEARWGGVLVLGTLATRSLERHEEATEARTALAWCDLAAPMLPAAPVNGIELVEDCLWAAGAARDQDRWHRWAGIWLADPSTGSGPEATAFLVGSAAPECARLPVDAEGLPAHDHGWGDWCAALTARTLRCVDGPGRRPRWCL